MNKLQIIQRQFKSLQGILLNLRDMFLHLPKKHRLFIVSISVFLLLLITLPTEQELTTQNTRSQGFELGKRYQVAMPQQASSSTTKNTIKIPAIKGAVIPDESMPNAIA
ncbi:MAG: hypothetical protein JKX76_09005, partial [Colwellia sp.]|nr:hypothetical protein [Colwellia sp.]